MAIVVVVLAIALGAGLVFVATRYLSVPNERPELVGAVHTAVIQAGSDGIVDFRNVATFEWDRMYEFGAYTPDSEVSAVLGFPWGSNDDMRLVSDSFVLLIFARGQEVTGWVVLNDYQSTGPLVRFDDALVERAIPRDAAVFRAGLDADRTTGGYAIYDLTQAK